MGSRVTVYLGFDELSVESEMRERAPEGEGPLDEGISATPESIHRQLEEGSGKVQPPPPPDADAPTGENPTIRSPTLGRGRRTVGRSGTVQRRPPEE